MAAYLTYVFVVRSNFTVCLILTIEILAVIADIGWFFQGLEEFGKTVVFGSSAKILNLAACFLFAPKAAYINVNPPTRPKNIDNIKINLDAIPSVGVIPSVSPTVPTAEAVS